MVKNKNILVWVVGVLVFSLHFKFIFLEPRDYANTKRNNYTKIEAEKYLDSIGKVDMSIGSPEWEYYLNVIGPEADALYKDHIFEASVDGVVFSMFISLLIVIFLDVGYLFGVLVNGPLLILFLGGASSILLLPMSVFLVFLYIRRKLLSI